MAIFGPFAISGVTGPHAEGPIAVPASATQMSFTLDRTVGAPSINGQAGLQLSAEMDYSFDGGVTFPRLGGNQANGGSITTNGGLHGNPTATQTAFTTHVPKESDVVQGGDPTRRPTHARMNFTVTGGTLNSTLSIVLS